MENLVPTNWQIASKQTKVIKCWVVGLVSGRKIPEWLKLSPKYLAAIALFVAVLLFAPRSFTDTLSLSQIIDTYRPWIGLAFVLTLSILAIHSFVPFVNCLKGRRQKFIILKDLRDRLHSLNPDEKAILRRFIFQNSRTQYLRPDDGVVSGLQTATIIYMASQIGKVGYRFKFAFNIQEWAWEYLHKHGELIEAVNTKNANFRCGMWSKQSFLIRISLGENSQEVTLEFTL